MVQCDKIRDAMATKPIEEIVQTVLSVAKRAQRITLGFSDAIKLLSSSPEEAQFCFLAEPKRGDSATHMHEVLLQAFCYEHGIYIIKVDSGRKLANASGTLSADETCVLIRKTRNNCSKMDRSGDASSGTGMATVTAALTSTNALCISDEDILVNFCENAWHNTDAYCIVELPEP